MLDSGCAGSRAALLERFWFLFADLPEPTPIIVEEVDKKKKTTTRMVTYQDPAPDL